MLPGSRWQSSAVKQVIGVRREVIPLDQGESETRDELGLYVTSCPREQPTDAERSEVIRGHWSAIENGTHHRKNVTLGKDTCRVAPRGAASVLASFCTLVIGVYELEQHQQRTNADSLPSWRRTRTFGPALAARRRRSGRWVEGVDLDLAASTAKQ